MIMLGLHVGADGDSVHVRQSGIGPDPDGVPGTASVRAGDYRGRSVHFDLTENQIIAAVLSFGTIMVLWLVDVVANNAESPTSKGVLTYLSILSHLDDFMKGVLSTSHIIFYLSLMLVGAFSDLSLDRLSALERMKMKEQLKKADLLGLCHHCRRAVISYSIRPIWTTYQTIAVGAWRLTCRRILSPSRAAKSAQGLAADRPDSESIRQSSVLFFLGILAFVNYLGRAACQASGHDDGEDLQPVGSVRQSSPQQVKQDLTIKAFYPGGEYAPAKDLLELFKDKEQQDFLRVHRSGQAAADGAAVHSDAYGEFQNPMTGETFRYGTLIMEMGGKTERIEKQPNRCAKKTSQTP